MPQMTAQESRTKFRELLNNAEVRGEPTAITRYGKPVAVLVPADWYAQAMSGEAPSVDETGAD